MSISDLSRGDDVVLQLQLGGDRNFQYLLGDRRSGEAAAVDPGFGPDEIAAAADAHGLRVRHVLITHGHSDHTGGAARLVATARATLWADPAAGVPGADDPTADAAIELGGRVLQGLPTPGHSPGHVCYRFGTWLCTGDLLFCGKVGGTGPYFPGSSAAAEWNSLHRLMELPAETVVLPGHDFYGGEGVRTWSTLDHERRHNPFLLQPDLAAFVRLKETWADYKREHGIR